MDIEIEQILKNLPQEESQVLQQYIEQLNSENEELSSDNDELCSQNEDLVDQIQDLEDEIEDLKADTILVGYIQEIIDDRYKYIVPTYDTKDKILDRLEFILKYEV